VTNHAHRRNGVPPADVGDRPGLVRRTLRFLGWLLGPSQGRDRFPRRGSVTGRMNRAVRSGYVRGSRRRP
jgi:hypothetical protein